MGELPRDYWRDHGVRIVSGSTLDLNTPQTPGMTRAAAVTHTRTGANKLWAGTVLIEPNATTGAHHHGDLECVVVVVSGRARIRWGEDLEYVAEARPGDFIYVPPYVPHQEINASRDEPLHCVVVGSAQEPVVVNLEIAPAEPPEEIRWVDEILPPAELPLPGQEPLHVLERLVGRERRQGVERRTGQAGQEGQEGREGRDGQERRSGRERRGAERKPH